MEKRNESTIVLTMKDNTIPPRGKVTKSIDSKSRKKLLELFLLLQIKATIGQIGQEERTVHMNGVRANGVMDKKTMIGPRGNPRNNRASNSIHNHIRGVMNVALKVLPCGALAKRRKRRAFSK
jgi:hypothetical protein